jgi:hypothetical protein
MTPERLKAWLSDRVIEGAAASSLSDLAIARAAFVEDRDPGTLDVRPADR